MEESVPKLRKDIELLPTYYQGERGVLVRDPLGLIKEPIFLKGEPVGLMSLIDGKRTIRDIQIELMRQKRGAFVSSDDVKGLLSELDSVFILDSENYRQQKNRIISEYSLLEVRKACHAGRSYPQTPKELRAYVDSFFYREEDPEEGLENNKIIALISPHIDLETGKRAYAKAYRAIKNITPKRIVLLGTGHNLHESFVALTEKDFETPLGRVMTDKDFVRELRKAGSGAVSPNDIAHRSEHSLEFQLIFLQHIFGSSFSLIPFLCGSFHKVLDKVLRPSDIPGVDSFLKVLGDFVKGHVSDTLLVAGVDFSHVGPKFGHSERASSMLLETKDHDKVLIDAICKGKIEDFWKTTREVKDRYNVCGFSAIACLLEIIKEAQGQLLAYDIWQEETTQSAVSFAAIAFERK
ncbi:MAG: AmmeMemoRadiSam system protein B [Candidatus Aminicenantes bacterium]|nr:MAG: AmmeMemoRadiSam system protein B [Candidatus Aminicenantes bacterium]